VERATEGKKSTFGKGHNMMPRVQPTKQDESEHSPDTTPFLIMLVFGRDARLLWRMMARQGIYRNSKLTTPLDCSVMRTPKSREGARRSGANARY
jgi:hypothetical protein